MAAMTSHANQELCMSVCSFLFWIKSMVDSLLVLWLYWANCYMVAAWDRKLTMDLPPPPQIKFDVPNLAEAWKKWQKSYDVYRVAKELHKKMDDVQIDVAAHSWVRSPRNLRILPVWRRGKSWGLQRWGPEVSVNIQNLSGTYYMKGNFFGKGINMKMRQ